MRIIIPCHLQYLFAFFFTVRPTHFLYLVGSGLEVGGLVDVSELLHEPVCGLDAAGDGSLHVVPPLVGLQPLQYLQTNVLVPSASPIPTNKCIGIFSLSHTYKQMYWYLQHGQYLLVIALYCTELN